MGKREEETPWAGSHGVGELEHMAMRAGHLE